MQELNYVSRPPYQTSQPAFRFTCFRFTVVVAALNTVSAFRSTYKNLLAELLGIKM